MWCNPFLVLFGLLIAQGCVAISGVVVNNHLVETNQKRNRIQFPTPLINNHLMAKFAEYMQQAVTKAPKGEITEVDAHREYNRLLKFHPNQGLLPFRNFDEYIITKNNFEQQLTTAFPTVGTNNYFDYLISLQNQNKNQPNFPYTEEYQYPPEQQYEEPVYYQRNKTMDKFFPLITSLNNHYLHQPITLSSASIEDAMEDPNEEYNSLYPATTPLNDAYVEIPKRRPYTYTMSPTRPATLFGFPTTIYTPTNYAPVTKSPSVTILSNPPHGATTQEPHTQYFSTTTEEPVLITIKTNYSHSTVSPELTQSSNTLSVITVTPSPRPKKKKKKKKPKPTITTTEPTVQKANVRPKLPTSTTTKAPIRIFHNYFIMNCSVLAKDTEKLKELMKKQSAIVGGVTITESTEQVDANPIGFYRPQPASIKIPHDIKKYAATPSPIYHSSSSHKKTKKISKPKKKIMYVDPPGVGEIKNVMDSVYGMMEDVFTDEKVVLDEEYDDGSDEDAREFRTAADNSTDFTLPEEKKGTTTRLSNSLLKRKYRVGSVDSTQYYDDETILSEQEQNNNDPQDEDQQSTEPDDIVVGHDSEELVSAEPQQEVNEESGVNYSTSTRRPIIYRVTPAGDSRQSKESKEKFTTNIHVTSEYVPPTKATPTPLPIRRKQKDSEEDSESEEYDEYDSEEYGSEEESGENRSESVERDDTDDDDDDEDYESDEDSYVDSSTSESYGSEEEIEEKNESLGLEDYNSIQFEYDNDDSSSEDATVFEFPDSVESPDYLAKSKNPSGDPSNDTQTNTTNVEALRKSLRKMDKKRRKKVKKCDTGKKPKGKKNKKKKSKKPKKRTKKKKKKNKEALSPPSDSLEEYEDEYASDFFSFMAEFFTTVGRYVPFFGPSKKPVEEEEDEARGTTPRIESMRKPKKPSYSSEKFFDLANVEDDVHTEEKQATPWYYPSFIYYNDYENEIPTTTTEKSWFDSLFSWNSWIDDTEPVATSIEAPVDESWFPSLNLFGAVTTSTTTTSTTTTTTTPQPPPLNIPFLTVSNPIKNPEKWLSILAQQLKVSTTTVKPTLEENVPPKPAKVYYDNYQLWRLNPRTRENVDYLDDYRRSPEGQKFKWWRGPSLRGATDVLVPPSMVQILKDFLDDESITQEVVIRDLQKVIEYENPRMTKREQIETEAIQGHPMTFYRYHRYADMLKYLDFIQRKFSRNVELVHIGRSYEGRPLIVVKLTFPDSDAPEPRIKNYRKGSKRKEKRSEKPAVFIEAGAHAREWISPASSLWIVDKLLRVIDNNETAEMDALKSVDWYILPLLNPDGYEFSHDYDRMWTKTRSFYSDKPAGILSTALNWLPLSQESEPRCLGVNLNRNWDIRWNQGPSASSYECSENFSGPKAFSEPETKSLSKWLMKYRKSIKIYISLHSYGQLITYPSSEHEDGFQQDELFDMAKVAVEALRASGNPSRYIIDNSNELMYPHYSGAADAFAMHKIGIKYSFTLELRDTGTHGFLLPSSYIESSAQEAYEIIKGMIDYI